MHIRLGKMKQILAMGLAVSAMAQTFLAMPATAAEAVEVPEAAETIEVPETVEPVELAPAEDIVTSKAAEASTTKYILWLDPDKPHSEAGLDWNNKTLTLTLTNYKGGKTIGVLRGKTTLGGSAINVIVNGDNTVSSLFVGNLDPAAPQLNITGKNKNADILRISSDEASASLLWTNRGSISISDVTLYLQSTATDGRVYGITINESEGHSIIIKNSILDIQMNSGNYSYGIGTDDGNSPVTVEDTVYRFRGPDSTTNGGAHPIKCGYADLILNHTEINMNGGAVAGIWAGNLRADRLTLNADLLSKEKPGYTSALRGTTAVINDSVINVTAQEAVRFDDVSMTNTTAEVTTYSYRNEYGRRDDGSGFEARSGSILMQGCDIKVNVTDADSGGELIFESSGFKSKSMTFSDSRIRIKINSVHPDDTGINSLDGTLVCKGNTTIQVESSQIAYMCNDGGGIDLRDGLAILTPAGGSVKPMPNAQNVNVILDARGNIAGNLVIGKGGTWKKDSKGWWYSYAGGGYPKNKWEKISGKWYHFDARGYMQTGWLKDGGKWYYLESSGAMATGWKKVSGKWYYFNSSGAMLANTSRTIKGKLYTFNKSGVCTNA